MHSNYFLWVILTYTAQAQKFHGYESAFSFDAGLGHHPRWMQDLPDDVPLSSLSIPGTHDSMSYMIPSDYLRCQNWNLSMQLEAGIRYFDIRARLREDELQIYHAHIYTGFSLTNVLLTMFEFLRRNPSEAIIMRLKEEGKPIGKSNTVSFEDAFKQHHGTDPHTAAGGSKHVLKFDQAAPLPLLGDIRSKILIVQQFPDEDGPYGLKWGGKQIISQDNWITPSLFHLAEKWIAIRNSIELAATADHDNSVLYITHTSTAVGVLPIEAAAGTVNRTVTGMNDMTGQWIEYLEDVPEATRTGVVVFDFPGRRLIDAVLRLNKPLERKPQFGGQCLSNWAHVESYVTIKLSSSTDLIQHYITLVQEPASEAKAMSVRDPRR
ncbi:PLC-like phosphodiesterase [Dactylonectria macrodidyma]|uniref:PLC-like phosphodiesterase n=1 Tax=Dactylonectria macrodidyma TaxID=307937 RepID=A0A9P9EE98_9HYPO|nr:PLC-like phosphodiesterase [Dactylonectria macrodidyma]